MTSPKEDKATQVIRHYSWLKIFRMDYFLAGVALLVTFLLASFALFVRQKGNCEISYKLVSHTLIMNYNLLEVKHPFRTKQGEIIECNLYQAKIRVKNSGSLAIDTIAIKTPLHIALRTTGNESRIIDYKIKTDFSVDYIKLNAFQRHNTVGILWNELPPGFEGEIYILYTSPRKENLIMDRYITNTVILNASNPMAFIWYRGKSIVIIFISVILLFVVRYILLSITFRRIKKKVIPGSGRVKFRLKESTTLPANVKEYLMKYYTRR